VSKICHGLMSERIINMSFDFRYKFCHLLARNNPDVQNERDHNLEFFIVSSPPEIFRKVLAVLSCHL